MWSETPVRFLRPKTGVPVPSVSFQDPFLPVLLRSDRLSVNSVDTDGDGGLGGRNQGDVSRRSLLQSPVVALRTYLFETGVCLLGRPSRRYVYGHRLVRSLRTVCLTLAPWTVTARRTPHEACVQDPPPTHRTLPHVRDPTEGWTWRRTYNVHEHYSSVDDEDADKWHSLRRTPPKPRHPRGTYTCTTYTRNTCDDTILRL